MELVTIASIITSLTVIFTAVIKVYKLVRRVENKLEAYDKNLEELNLHLNKMALLDTNLPLIDRIHAGEWYIAHGGNGIGKKVYNQLLDELDTSAWGNSTWAKAQANKEGEVDVKLQIK